MYRRVVPLGVVLTAACLSLAWCVPIDKAAEQKAKENEGFTSKKLIAALNKRITIDKIPENTPLKDAIDYLSDKAELPIIVDEKAFESISLAKVGEQPVSVPALKGVRVATVLNMIAKQVRGDAGYVGTFLVRGDQVEVTTTYHAWTELSGTEVPASEEKAAGDGPGVPAPPADSSVKPELVPIGSTKRLALPVVHVDFDQKPLRDVIQELADTTGATIIVDGRVGEKAKAPVTATFANAFLDTALDLSADAADLVVVRVDNTFYVTTPERAEKVRKQRPRRFDGGAPGFPMGPTPGA